MKRTTIFRRAIIWSSLLFAGLFPARAEASPALIDPLMVDVWVDKGENAVYRNGEEIAVYFRASEDCFVVLYDIDTNGRTRILFPQYPDDGFVAAGRTYCLPDYYDRFAMRVSGPRGVEYIQAVASRTPRAFRYHTFHREYRLRDEFIVGDPFEGINRINEGLIGEDYLHATATTQFFVEGYVWYPRYVCGNCHNPVPAGFDPYESACPRYQIVAVHQYDYWWGYNYHPALVRFRFGGPFWRWEARSGYYFRHRPHVEWCRVGLGYMNFYSTVPLRRGYVERPREEVRYREQRQYQRDYHPGEVTYDRVRSGSVRDARTPATGSGNDRYGTGTPDQVRANRTENPGRTRDQSTAPEKPRIDTRSTEPSRDESRGRVQQTDDRAGGRVQTDGKGSDGVRTRETVSPTPNRSGSERGRSERIPPPSSLERQPGRMRVDQPRVNDRSVDADRSRGRGQSSPSGRERESSRSNAPAADRSDGRTRGR